MTEEQEKTILNAECGVKENPTDLELQVALGMAYFYAESLDAAMTEHWTAAIDCQPAACLRPALPICMCRILQGRRLRLWPMRARSNRSSACSTQQGRWGGLSISSRRLRK